MLGIKFILSSALFLLLVNYSLTQESEKQNKVKACVKISKARILNDSVRKFFLTIFY